MDLALRTLREGRPEGSPAPLLLLYDELAALGGPALLRHAVAELAAAIAGGRAQACTLTVVALERPPLQYQQLCSTLTAGSLTVLDCFSNPYAPWGDVLGGSGSGSGSSSSGGGSGSSSSSSGGASGGGGVSIRGGIGGGIISGTGSVVGAAAATVVSLPGILTAPDGLQQLHRCLSSSPAALAAAATAAAAAGAAQAGGAAGAGARSGAGAGPRPLQCIVIDGGSVLLDAFGPAGTARLLHSLQAAGGSTSCLLCALHADLHPPPALAALEQLAAGTLQLHPATELERSMCRASAASAATSGAAGVAGAGAGAPREPQGRLVVRLKRTKTGRVRAETQLYCISGGGAAIPPTRSLGAVAAGAPAGTASNPTAVEFLELPRDLLSMQAAAEKAAAAAAGGAPPAAAGSGSEPAAAGGGAAGPLLPATAGGMKLSLSQAEQEARQRVQLPFEHQGHGAAYQTGDFRDYLPPEAGGRAGAGVGAGAAGRARPPSAGPSSGAPTAPAAAPAAAAAPAGSAVPNARVAGSAAASAAAEGQRLGRILYVRDSGSEHDSDEDPDDDLDI